MRENINSGRVWWRPKLCHKMSLSILIKTMNTAYIIARVLTLHLPESAEKQKQNIIARQPLQTLCPVYAYWYVQKLLNTNSFLSSQPECKFKTVYKSYCHPKYRGRRIDWIYNYPDPDICSISGNCYKIRRTQTVASDIFEQILKLLVLGRK